MALLTKSTCLSSQLAPCTCYPAVADIMQLPSAAHVLTGTPILKASTEVCILCRQRFRIVSLIWQLVCDSSCSGDDCFGFLIDLLIT